MDLELEKFVKKHENDKKVTEEVSQKIIDLLKGVDRIGSLSDIFARIFEHTETPDGPDDHYGINNIFVSWGIERYAGNKLKSIFDKIIMLYEYCIYKGYSVDNNWEYDTNSHVSYIETNDKKVLLFNTNNLNFVVVIHDSHIHIRKVYESLFDSDDKCFYSYDNKGFNSVSELRKGLKTEKGLEIALSLISDKYSDSFDGVSHPKRIDLTNMKKHNFGKCCEAFRYGDNRDAGYLMSVSKYVSECEIFNINIADYVYCNIRSAIMYIPQSFLIKEKRKKNLDKLLKNE